MTAMLIWTEVVCDGCNATTCGEYARNAYRRMRPLKRELKKQGWVVHHRTDKIYCPDCVRRLNPVNLR